MNEPAYTLPYSRLSNYVLPTGVPWKELKKDNMHIILGFFSSSDFSYIRNVKIVEEPSDYSIHVVQLEDGCWIQDILYSNHYRRHLRSTPEYLYHCFQLYYPL
jgi:hypothetical protein